MKYEWYVPDMHLCIEEKMEEIWQIRTTNNPIENT